MTKVVFESASFVDAIKKADRVAPAKGSAFDKAAGIVIEIYNGDNPQVIVRSTDTDVYFTQWVDPISMEGPTTTWRLPSRLFGGLVSTLPVGDGSTVTLTEKPEERGRIVHLTTNKKTRCKFGLIDPEYYPMWLPFETDNLTPVNDLGGRLAQVAWAAAKGDEKIGGVHFDGEVAVATDKYRLASVPIKMDLERPITIPGEILSSLLRQTGEVKIGTDGNQFLLEPDESSQIMTTMSGLEYPNFKRVMKREYPQKVTCAKADLLEIINRSLTFVGADRYPILRVYIGKEEINVFMADQERGLLGDAVEIPGQATHTRCEIKFTPKNLIEALDNAPNNTVTLAYDPDKTEGIFYIDGGSGYEAWVMPRRAQDPNS